MLDSLKYPNLFVKRKAQLTYHSLIYPNTQAQTIKNSCWVRNSKKKGTWLQLFLMPDLT